MKRLPVLGSSCLVCLLSVMAAAQDPQPNDEDSKNFWMTEKLELTQQVLAALATEQYDEIAVKANRLRRLSTIEGWARRTEAAAYRRQLRIFQRTAELLASEADEENLDGATLAFTQMTVSCVNCHKELRTPDHAPAVP
jgi:hypothetical protein